MRLLDKEQVMLTSTRSGWRRRARGVRGSVPAPQRCSARDRSTGSGKSTTLYAALNAIRSDERNYITIEDPVEYQLPGINQIQIKPKAKLGFAEALRSMLRADPDVMMVGEIRDTPTAKIAIESALTGHLVLSTLHTNDAPGALTRLTEMGVEPPDTCVVAQRLLRTLCVECSSAPCSRPTSSRRRASTPACRSRRSRRSGAPSCGTRAIAVAPACTRSWRWTRRSVTLPSGAPRPTRSEPGRSRTACGSCATTACARSASVRRPWPRS